MRWWTLGFAALLAAGGLATSLAHGSAEAAQVGLGAGAVLAVCAGAMSDMRDPVTGHLAVKLAWGEGAWEGGCVCCTCLLLAVGALAWRRAASGACVRGPHGGWRGWRRTLAPAHAPNPLLRPPPSRAVRSRPCPARPAATCAALAGYEYFRGWRHKRTRRGRRPHLEGCGLAAAAMCALYMATGMSGLSQYALPTNPGEAFKMVDVAEKSKVWARWGYGSMEMRG
jgi:hypothetical protein